MYLTGVSAKDKKGKLVLFDHLLLEPNDEISDIMQMEGYTHIGTFLMLHQGIDNIFLDRLYEIAEEGRSDVRFGISALPEKGIILRILARNTGAVEKLITNAHTFARRELLGKNFVNWRKY